MSQPIEKANQGALAVLEHLPTTVARSSAAANLYVLRQNELIERMAKDFKLMPLSVMENLHKVKKFGQSIKQEIDYVAEESEKGINRATKLVRANSLSQAAKVHHLETEVKNLRSKVALLQSHLKKEQALNFSQLMEMVGGEDSFEGNVEEGNSSTPKTKQSAPAALSTPKTVAPDGSMPKPAAPDGSTTKPTATDGSKPAAPEESTPTASEGLTPNPAVSEGSTLKKPKTQT
jgi:hypothetical protein